MNLIFEGQEINYGCFQFFIAYNMVGGLHLVWSNSRSYKQITVYHYAVMEVSSRSRLGLEVQRSRSRSRGDYSIETKGPEFERRKKWKKRHEKNHSVDGRFPYPSEKNDVFRVEKYLKRKILGLGLSLGLGNLKVSVSEGWSRSRMVRSWSRSRITRPRLHHW